MVSPCVIWIHAIIFLHWLLLLLLSSEYSKISYTLQQAFKTPEKTLVYWTYKVFKSPGFKG
jgi:hypothetical protein